MTDEGVMRIHNQQNKSLATNLRTNMTKEEKKLWYQFLKKLSVTFYRQKPFGNYIVDFYCASKQLVIELDGTQHFEEQGKQYDETRDAYLQSLGLTVLRIANCDVNRHFDAVCQLILSKLGIDK